ncbi:MAG: hypothetical protein R3C44_22335 [Chloroflexota bacterium]
MEAADANRFLESGQVVGNVVLVTDAWLAHTGSEGNLPTGNGRKS